MISLMSGQVEIDVLASSVRLVAARGGYFANSLKKRCRNASNFKTVSPDFNFNCKFEMQYQFLLT